MSNIYKIEHRLNEEEVPDNDLFKRLLYEIKPKTTEDMIEYGVWALFIITILIIICFCTVDFSIFRKRTNKKV